jgi:peptidoglycan/LPS O-acetylase OafA/YrhL
MTSTFDSKPRHSVSRLPTVDCLRGVAACAVVWFHLTNGNPHQNTPQWLKASGRLGWVGVDVFFVISGFIIPYALHRSGYRLAHYRRFVLKRIVRLDPPYLASMALAMGLTGISALLHGFRGPTATYTVPQVLSHLAYMNRLFGYEPIIGVYWTLALEFQYYLFLGLAYPVLTDPRGWTRGVALLALAAAALAAPSQLLVFRWLFLFMLGIVTFYHRTGSLRASWYLPAVLGASAGVWLTIGIEVAIAGAATSLLVAFADIRSAPLLFLGEISYSLYLIHEPVVGRILTDGERLRLNEGEMVALTFAALAISIASAYVFYRAVELPARAWAQRIAYPTVELESERMAIVVT